MMGPMRSLEANGGHEHSAGARDDERWASRSKKHAVGSWAQEG